MTPRHQAREWAVQLLYQRDFHPDEADIDIEGFFSEQPHHVAARQFAEVLYKGVLENLQELERRLDRYAQNWSAERMNAVDRNILRLALYELFYRNDIPPIVTIDEAVTLAKELSDEQAGKFVNGILDRASKELDRPLRAPLPKDEQ